MMQVAKKIPFEDPDVLNIIRAVYASSNLLILGIYLFIQSKIDKNKGGSPSPVFGVCHCAAKCLR